MAPKGRRPRTTARTAASTSSSQAAEASEDLAVADALVAGGDVDGDCLLVAGGEAGGVAKAVVMPSVDELEAMSRPQLMHLAKELGMKTSARIKKSELVVLLSQTKEQEQPKTDSPTAQDETPAISSIDCPSKHQADSPVIMASVNLAGEKEKWTAAVLNRFTRPKLQAMAKEVGVSAEGKKADIIARLMVSPSQPFETQVSKDTESGQSIPAVDEVGFVVVPDTDPKNVELAKTGSTKKVSQVEAARDIVLENPLSGKQVVEFEGDRQADEQRQPSVSTDQTVTLQERQDSVEPQTDTMGVTATEDPPFLQHILESSHMLCDSPDVSSQTHKVIEAIPIPPSEPHPIPLPTNKPQNPPTHQMLDITPVIPSRTGQGEPIHRIYCSIERRVVLDVHPKGCGKALLRSAEVFVLDWRSGKEHGLKIPLGNRAEDVPADLEDNVVCGGCVDRNRAMGLFFRNKPIDKSVSFTESSGGETSPSRSALQAAAPSEAIAPRSSLFADPPHPMIDSTRPSRLPVLQPHPPTNIFPPHRAPVKENPLKNPIEKSIQRRTKRIETSVTLSQQARKDAQMAHRMSRAFVDDSPPSSQVVTSSQGGSLADGSDLSKTPVLPYLSHPIHRRRLGVEPATKGPEASPGKGRRLSYVPKEDLNVVRNVEEILGKVVSGSPEEWEVVGGRRGSVIRSPPKLGEV
ncbi:hypothetical protein HDU67_003689 [Dinochytrium kinnereticum]|nr:hypothetical protein HDU67_003689 [Dinochytrium kinnereticum]